MEQPLGADDKAVTEIVTWWSSYLIQIKHGKIRVGFTPDEEIELLGTFTR
jgi:di/tripeptidase